MERPRVDNCFTSTQSTIDSYGWKSTSVQYLTNKQKKFKLITLYILIEYGN